MLQAQASGLVKDIWQMRQIIADSTDMVRYEPTDTPAWDEAFERFQKITK